jgi:hypothetical protein
MKAFELSAGIPHNAYSDQRHHDLCALRRNGTCRRFAPWLWRDRRHMGDLFPRATRQVALSVASIT